MVSVRLLLHAVKSYAICMAVKQALGLLISGATSRWFVRKAARDMESHALRPQAAHASMASGRYIGTVQHVRQQPRRPRAGSKREWWRGVMYPIFGKSPRLWTVKHVAYG